jgi:hypothetical protein
MSHPPKKKRAPAKSALQEAVPSIYEFDKEAQEKFARHAGWLLGEWWRTGKEKHLRAFQVHIEAARDYRPKLVRLLRGHSFGWLTYELRQLWHIAEGSSEQKRKARQPGKKGGAQ